MIYWLTGQPGAGKTTLGNWLIAALQGNAVLVDGDDIREIFENKDYSEQGRRKNIELAQQIAQYLTNKGKDVLVSLVSPYKDQRDKFKEKMRDDLVEVYVHTTEIRGKEEFFVENYEQPTENYLYICTDNITVDKCVKQILE